MLAVVLLQAPRTVCVAIGGVELRRRSEKVSAAQLLCSTLEAVDILDATTLAQLERLLGELPVPIHADLRAARSSRDGLDA